MNIVIGTDSFLPVFNGVVTHIVMYAKLLALDGHKVLIVAPRYPGLQDSDEWTAGGISVLRLPSYSVAKLFFSRDYDNRFVSPFCRRKLFRYLDAFSPDIIHCHTEFSVGKHLRAYSNRNHLPLVITAHTYFEFYMQFYFPWLPKFFCRKIAKRIERNFFRKADCLIVPTQEMKKVLLSYHIDKNIHIIPTGMQDEDYMFPNPEELSNFRTKNPVFQKRVLLFVGRIVEEKNVFFLLKAFAKLTDEYPDLSLVFVGRGFAKRELIEQAETYGVGSKVFFFPPVPREELKLYYHACTIFVFPSVTETQGLVVLEAMASGKPVAGMDAMGVGEVMGKEAFGGTLSQEGDLEGYINNLRKLLSDSAFYVSKCQEALELAQSFHIRPYYQELQRLYLDMLP